MDSDDLEDANGESQGISERKIEANRENAQHSTGPQTPEGKRNVSQNARKHGLLSKCLRFKDEDDRADFEEWVTDLETYFQPVGPLERELVSEIALSHWKSRMAEGWMMQDLAVRRNAASALLEVFINSWRGAANPFSKQEAEVQTAARAGLHCRELAIKVGGNEAAALNNIHPMRRDRRNNQSNVQFEARLGDSADTFLRYQNAWKRDLYRAMEALKKLQQGRKPHAANPGTPK